MEKYSTLENGVTKINTGAIDYLNDEIIIYHTNQKYTDDGYYWNEMTMWGSIEEAEKVEVAKCIASWYACKFDTESKEFSCAIGGSNGVSLLKQTITAVCAWININRMSLS